MEHDFHGIIVRGSLGNNLLLNDAAILGWKKGKDWELIRVGVLNSNIERFVEAVSESLRITEGVPYYAHFYSKDRLLVVFPHKVFNITPSKESWKPVIEYGLSKGIPIEQLDFFPCRFQDETY